MSSSQDKFEYILSAISKKLVSKTEIEAATGVDKSTLYRWQKNISVPRGKKIDQIYQYIKEKMESRAQYPYAGGYVDLKNYRRSMGLNQADIERLTGIARTRVSRYENGKEVNENLTKTFISALEGIHPYVVVNYTGRSVQDIHDTVMSKLVELTPLKLAAVEGFIGKMMLGDADIDQLEKTRQILVKTSDLLDHDLDVGLVEVDIDTYAPSINIGDKLQVSRDRHWADGTRESSVAIAIYQDDQNQIKFTIGRIFVKPNKNDPRKPNVLINYKDINLDPLWLVGSDIIRIYRIDSHIRQMS